MSVCVLNTVEKSVGGELINFLIVGMTPESQILNNYLYRWTNNYLLKSNLQKWGIWKLCVVGGEGLEYQNKSGFSSSLDFNSITVLKYSTSNHFEMSLALDGILSEQRKETRRECFQCQLHLKVFGTLIFKYEHPWWALLNCKMEYNTERHCSMIPKSSS